MHALMYSGTNFMISRRIINAGRSARRALSASSRSPKIVSIQLVKWDPGAEGDQAWWPDNASRDMVILIRRSPTRKNLGGERDKNDSGP